MLQVPQVGFRYSVTQSNVETNVLADWIEIIGLFDDAKITKSNVIDALIEYQICHHERQELARQITDDGWEEVNRRQRWGGIPKSVSISSSRIESSNEWQEDPIRAFFLLLSALRIFPDWAKNHQSHAVQGNLFERVVELICPNLLPGWAIFRVGWSSNNTQNIPQIVRELCSRLHTSGATDLSEWISPSAKDGGLDIVCYRPFSDEREAVPVFFLQCASGKSWRDKVKTPNADIWQKYLNSAVRPSTGIAAPFVVGEKELRMAALTGQVIVFDRLRMLDAINAAGIVLAQDLLDELIDWMRPRVLDLPKSK